jgi:hypothetical protein
MRRVRHRDDGGQSSPPEAIVLPPTRRLPVAGWGLLASWPGPASGVLPGQRAQRRGRSLGRGRTESAVLGRGPPSRSVGDRDEPARGPSH